VKSVIVIIWLELLKIWKRPLSWIIMGLAVVSVVGTLMGAYRLLQSGSLYNATTDQVISLEEGIKNFILPAALPAALEITRTVGSWLLVIFTAIFIGMEEAWGTLRVMLSTGISRGQYLAGKLGALLVVVVGFVLVALLSGAVTAYIIQSTTNIAIAGPFVGSVWASLFLMNVRVIAVLYVSILLTVFATIVSRSQVTGIAVGLGYYLFEAVAKNLFDSLGPLGETVRSLLIGNNITTIMALNHFGSETVAELSPPVGEAFVALILYAILFIGGSWLIFSRRDITSARGQ
jgi:ABC-type transport system involved in multi-copper enzyme maturation permease subunit